MIQSPMNYTGGKYKLLPQILPYFPTEINTFLDLFCGGCNVGINVTAKKTIYNDIDEHLCHLYNTFKTLDNDTIFSSIYSIIGKYQLSEASKYGYEYYNCNSSSGLGTYNKDKYLKLRDDFNNLIIRDSKYAIMLYVLIVYSFNNQIRFNSKGKFNLPVGKRDFNDKMAIKLSNFLTKIKLQNCSFSSLDFRDIDIEMLHEGDFVYADPPYLITCATYNESGGWSEECEEDLLAFLDELSVRNIKFALSNVIESKGKTNTVLLKWAQKNAEKYRMIHLNHSYSNSNYQIKNKDAVTKEVLVINY